MNENVTELRRSLAGSIVVPDDVGYDAARRCFNALVDRRPALIARCAGAGDVATAFDFARSNELEVAVRGGGHNPAGHCVSDGALVIDLSLLRTVDVDAGGRRASAGGGATWLDFDSATQAFDLVTPGGVVGSTGVGGLTLGGGIGHLTAQHGLTCDSLIGAEMVTPDGTVIEAGPEENTDSSGASAAAEATSASSRASTSACIRSTAWSAVCSRSAGRAYVRAFGASAMSSQALRATSVVRSRSR